MAYLTREQVLQANPNAIFRQPGQMANVGDFVSIYGGRDQFGNMPGDMGFGLYGMPEDLFTEAKNHGLAGHELAGLALFAAPLAGMVAAAAGAGAAGAGAADFSAPLWGGTEAASGWSTLGGTSAGAGAGFAGDATWGVNPLDGGGMDWWTEYGLTPADVGLEVNPWTTDPSLVDLGGTIDAGGGGWSYDDFLKEIGIDPGSTQFSGGTSSNADIMKEIMGGGTTTDWKKLRDTVKLMGGDPQKLAGLLSSRGAGALLGGAAGLMGGSKQAGTITTIEDLPEWVKPYALAGLGDMNTAHGMTPYRSPVTMAGEDYYGDVIGGDYLNANPYLDEMYDKAAGKVGANVAGYFSGKGRYGSGAHQGVLQEGLNNLATDIYGANYARERGFQNQLAMDSDDFGTASILQPFRRGQALLSGATSVKGGTSSVPYFRNRGAEILGGAMGGSRLLG